MERVFSKLSGGRFRIKVALTRAHVLVTGGLIMTPGAFLVFIPVKEKATHPLVKGMVRWAFFRGTVLIDVQTPGLQKGREIGRNSEYNKGEWNF